MGNRMPPIGKISKLKAKFSGNPRLPEEEKKRRKELHDKEERIDEILEQSKLEETGFYEVLDYLLLSTDFNADHKASCLEKLVVKEFDRDRTNVLNKIFSVPDITRYRASDKLPKKVDGELSKSASQEDLLLAETADEPYKKYLGHATDEQRFILIAERWSSVPKDSSDIAVQITNKFYGYLSSEVVDFNENEKKSFAEKIGKDDSRQKYFKAVLEVMKEDDFVLQDFTNIIFPEIFNEYIRNENLEDDERARLTSVLFVNFKSLGIFEDSIKSAAEYLSRVESQEAPFNAIINSLSKDVLLSDIDGKDPLCILKEEAKKFPDLISSEYIERVDKSIVATPSKLDSFKASGTATLKRGKEAAEAAAAAGLDTAAGKYDDAVVAARRHNNLNAASTASAENNAASTSSVAEDNKEEPHNTKHKNSAAQKRKEEIRDNRPPVKPKKPKKTRKHNKPNEEPEASTKENGEENSTVIAAEASPGSDGAKKGEDVVKPATEPSEKPKTGRLTKMSNVVGKAVQVVTNTMPSRSKGASIEPNPIDKPQSALESVNEKFEEDLKSPGDDQQKYKIFADYVMGLVEVIDQEEPVATKVGGAIDAGIQDSFARLAGIDSGEFSKYYKIVMKQSTFTASTEEAKKECKENKTRYDQYSSKMDGLMKSITTVINQLSQGDQGQYKEFNDAWGHANFNVNGLTVLTSEIIRKRDDLNPGRQKGQKNNEAPAISPETKLTPAATTGRRVSILTNDTSPGFWTGRLRRGQAAKPTDSSNKLAEDVKTPDTPENKVAMDLVVSGMLNEHSSKKIKKNDEELHQLAQQDKVFKGLLMPASNRIGGGGGEAKKLLKSVKKNIADKITAGNDDGLDTTKIYGGVGLKIQEWDMGKGVTEFRVLEVAPGSPADKAGIKASEGDNIVRIKGINKIKGMSLDVFKEHGRGDIGKPVSYKIESDGKTKTFAMKFTAIQEKNSMLKLGHFSEEVDRAAVSGIVNNALTVANPARTR